jgi:hypothetical protein
MQLHHDFHPEAEMRTREAEERVLQGRHRRAAEQTKPGHPNHELWHSLAVSVTHLRRRARVAYGSAFHRHAHGMHRPHG